MHQATQTAGQPVADLAQGVGAAELAKQHGDERRPAGKPLGSAVAAMLLHQCGKLGPRKMLEQLIEQAGYLYDCLALLVGDVWRGPAKERFANVHYRRAFLFATSRKNCLGQGCFFSESRNGCPEQKSLRCRAW